MKILSKQLKLAKRYATALFKLCKEEKNYDELVSSLDFASGVFESSLELEGFLLSKTVKKEDKKDILNTIFKGKSLHPYVLNLLCILVEEHKFDHFAAIKQSFEIMVNEENNIAIAQIISAVDLDNDDKKKIITKLETKLSKTINASYVVDEKIIAGLVIKIGDNLIDNSHRTKLDNLKKHLI